MAAKPTFYPTAAEFRRWLEANHAPAPELLASGFHGTLYTGVTSGLLGRVWQHCEGVTRGFTARYGVKRLVGSRSTKRWKAQSGGKSRSSDWHRKWKIELVEKENPTWRDLAEDFGFEALIKKNADPGSRPGYRMRMFKQPTFFPTEAHFRRWLEANHETAEELLVGFWKKGSGKPSIDWPQARDPSSSRP